MNLETSIFRTEDTIDALFDVTKQFQEIYYGYPASLENLSKFKEFIESRSKKDAIANSIHLTSRITLIP